MMKNIDYIIVGDGYAAMFFAHQLIKNKCSFKLFSEDKKGASHVSAGIINPVVLKRFNTFWLAMEQIESLKTTLSEIETYTGKNYLINEPIHRIFHDEKEKELWQKKSNREELLPFLNLNFTQEEGYKNPFGTGKVNHSGRLNVTDFFTDMFHYLEEKEYLIKEKFNYENLNPAGKTYQNIKFKKIIFCEGTGVLGNPFFNQIPIYPNKGHHLMVTLSQPIPKKNTLKKKHFLFPKNENEYYYGGTYDRETKDLEINALAVEQLEKGLSEFYPYDYHIQAVHFGFRPTVKDRRPIIGNHHQYHDFFVFNGLGARGILNGNYFAKILFNHIDKNQHLPQEVNINRFSE